LWLLGRKSQDSLKEGGSRPFFDSRMRLVPLLVPLLGLSLGCNKVVGEAHATEPAGSAKKHVDKPAPAASSHAKSDEHTSSVGARYPVPFAWEVSKDEPLAKTRAFFGDVLGDNERYARRGQAYFAPLAKSQSPRATVVACSDSRVQSDAWDATAVNDDFTIRNIGNQVKNARGSIEYGVEHLETPVLFVLGHTGCGAVKAALGKREGLSPAIRGELEALRLPDLEKGADEKKAWAQGVVANVNLQVGIALSEFGALVARGNLTVVGAVYDLTNELGRGYGRISIVNVNGNGEPERLKAFEAAVRKGTPGEPRDGLSEAELAAIATVDALAGHAQNATARRGAAAGSPAPELVLQQPEALRRPERSAPGSDVGRQVKGGHEPSHAGH
jgi:carbonic anhydrase